MRMTCTIHLLDTTGTDPKRMKFIEYRFEWLMGPFLHTLFDSYLFIFFRFKRKSMHLFNGESSLIQPNQKKIKKKK